MSFSGSHQAQRGPDDLANSQHVDVVLLSVTWATPTGVGLALATECPQAAVRRTFMLRELRLAGGQAEKRW